MNQKGQVQRSRFSFCKSPSDETILPPPPHKSSVARLRGLRLLGFRPWHRLGQWDYFPTLQRLSNFHLASSFSKAKSSQHPIELPLALPWRRFRPFSQPIWVQPRHWLPSLPRADLIPLRHLISPVPADLSLRRHHIPPPVRGPEFYLEFLQRGFYQLFPAFGIFKQHAVIRLTKQANFGQVLPDFPQHQIRPVRCCALRHKGNPLAERRVVSRPAKELPRAPKRSGESMR